MAELKKDYAELVNEIISSYQWWGVDLTSLLDNIKITDGVAYEAFNYLYAKKRNSYELKDLKTRRLFLDRLQKIILKCETPYVTFDAIPLSGSYQELRYNTNFCQRNYDYVLAILLFSQEFLYKNMRKDNQVTSYDYREINREIKTISNIHTLSGYNDMSSCIITGDGITRMEASIIYPNKAIVRYNAYVDEPQRLVLK